MESPFAAARTIRDIGSYLPADLGGKPYDREEHRRASKAWHERSQTPLPPSVENREYFNNWMADQEILDLEISESRVRLTVDLDDAQCFANALGEILGREVARRSWPVDLLMRGVRYVRAVACDSCGDLVDVALEGRVPRDRNCVGYLVNEWFYAHGDRLGWVAETYGLGPSKASPTIHLLVDCEGASVLDRRPDALVGEFGLAALPLWSDALRDLVENDRPRDFWLYEDLAEYLASRLDANTLKASDFRS